MNQQVRDSAVPVQDAGPVAPQADEARPAGHASHRARWVTLMVLGGPMLAFGLCLVAMGWYDPAAGALRHPGSIGQMAGALLCSSLGIALAGFWPFHLFAGGPRASGRG